MLYLIGFLMSVSPQPSVSMHFGRPGMSRIQKTKRLLRPDGHLFAADEKGRYLKFEPKGGL